MKKLRYCKPIVYTCMSCYGNVSMASHLPIYRKYVYQWRVCQVVLVYGLHRLEVCSCRECWHLPVSGASTSTVPQCGTVCRLLCATTVSHWTRSRGSWRLIWLDSNRTPPGADVAFCDFGAVYNICHDLLTYLLTYLAFSVWTVKLHRTSNCTQ